MAGRIHAVTASAGAGKTTRIVADIVDEVGKRPPEAIVATTFTIKAAAELVQRTRARLFATGNPDAAARLLGARFGTVNAVCGQIVSEFAIDLGRSPATEVLSPDAEPHLFASAANGPISRHAPELNALAERFGHNEPVRFGAKPPDWRKTLRDIITFARANGLDAAGLRLSAHRSLETFAPLLDAADSDGQRLDQALADAVSEALTIAPNIISTGGRETLAVLRTAHNRLQRRERPNWPDWVRLSNAKCAPTKDGRDYDSRLSVVRAAAGRHTDHPALKADCEQFIRCIFDCAAEALDAYQLFKAQRGLLDFTDQETLALEILNDPECSGRLSERIDRVFVDEFQDSSPLQMAVFTRLAETVEASTWVGDPKQAIFGFRGADSDLTQAAFDGVQRPDAAVDVLVKSYRSREGITAFSNAMFSNAFARMGLRPDQHDFSGTARSEAGFDHSPFGYWPLVGTAAEQTEALAVGVVKLLEDAGEWLVSNGANDLRPLTAGDIAILCRTNDDITRFATAIARRGVAVAVERNGLARTPHVEVVLAAYRWLIDQSDRLALAELARFFAASPTSDAWLAAASDEDADGALRQLVPIADDLAALGEAVLQLTPAELIDAVLALPPLMARIQRWGDHAIRLDDLEALRGCATTYEADCTSHGVPATPAGLLLALADTDPKRPRSLGRHAVQIMTYHTAKGLEWPLVVLTGLGKEPKARLFEPSAEVDGEIDWRQPLRNRWIRFWPWPYGAQGKGGRLDTNAASSAIGKAAQARIVKEETRLLYVGVTRARDHLVLGHAIKAGSAWLSVLDDPEAPGHVVLPSVDDNLIGVGDKTFACRVLTPTTEGDSVPRLRRAAFVSRASAPTRPARPLHLAPSASAGGAWAVVERSILGDRLALRGRPDMQRVGHALHGFLAADRLHRTADDRRAMAKNLLGRWDVSELDPDQVLEASDRLHRHIAERWPASTVLREAAIKARLGDQLLSGRIDMLIYGPMGYVVIDHKSFPGSPDQWEARATGYGAQLGSYAAAIRRTSETKCDSLYIHMPLVGVMLRLGPTEGGGSR